MRWMLFTKPVDNPVFNFPYSDLIHCSHWSFVKLTKDWSDVFLKNTMQPETVDEAVEWLITVLEDRHKMLLTIMREDELIDLHFGLGLSIRNSFGLHDADGKLFRDCGVDNSDDASDVIIKALWNKLKHDV
jgi:hypothetical protein